MQTQPIIHFQSKCGYFIYGTIKKYGNSWQLYCQSALFQIKLNSNKEKSGFSISSVRQIIRAIHSIGIKCNEFKF